MYFGFIIICGLVKNVEGKWIWYVNFLDEILIVFKGDNLCWIEIFIYEGYYFFVDIIGLISWVWWF